ncbi:FUSC family protein [Amycolatopsis benzoatilytica]|uniref:FUSC family protein n=1 Tax=Amycolatopsis benzoatilytica TaxID=346045 RepID=UPI00036DF615|nr:FUSC family protein [Amycolatopsis benzoatilytica]
MSFSLDRTPLGWAARAIRVPGSERRIVLQAAKATIAAVAAWLLSTQVLGLSQPFLAPYAAVFLVEATVYRSLLGWAQQVGSVAAGVLLAAAVAHLLPEQTATLAVVVFVGLLLGSWRQFGSSGVWVGVTGMLLVTYGTARSSELLGDRLLETALGAAVGLAVNSLLFPPLYGERLAEAAHRLAEAHAGLLEDAAELVRTDEPPADLESWLGRVGDVRSLARAAEDASGLSREGRFLNLRKRSRHAGRQLDRPLRTLVTLWPAVEQLAEAVRTTAEGREPFIYPWPGARDVLADVLRELATAVRLAATPGREPELARCRSLVSQVEDRLVSSQDGVTATLGLGALALPARRLLRQLDGE